MSEFIIKYFSPEQFVDHYPELVGLEMMELRRVGGTFAGANSATHALGRLDLGLAVLIAERSVVRAYGETGHARDTFVLVDVRDLGADIELLFGKHGCGTCGGRLRLRNILVDALGRMGQPAEENALGCEIDGTQLHGSLDKEADAVERDLEHVRKPLVLRVGLDAGAENDIVGFDFNRLGKVRGCYF